MGRPLSREYQIAAEYRRCCWYVILTAIILPIIGVWVSNYTGQLPPSSRIEQFLTFGLLTGLTILAAAYPIAWKLRVNESGIARRRYFLWDDWRWADFASGSIEKRYPYTFVDGSRTWGSRSLRLVYLDKDGVQDLVGCINQHYKLPPPPNLPSTMTIKYGFRRSLTFEQRGIRLTVRGKTDQYTWQDVKQVHFLRSDPLRRDFGNLQIRMRDRQIELGLVSHQGGRSPTWSGATAEQISHFLTCKVPEERIITTIVGERSTDRDFLEQRAEKLEKSLRDFRMMMVCFIGPLMIAMFVLLAVTESVFKAVLMLSLITLPFGSVIVYMHRMLRSQLEETRRVLDEIRR